MTPPDARLPLLTASDFLARLGPAVLPSIELMPEHHNHVPGLFNTEWVAAASLPVADEKLPAQTVALVDGPEFQRSTALDMAAGAYQERPRTRVYESLDVRSDGWFSLASLHLAGMLRRGVVCTAYESRTGDRTLGAHYDHWLGVIVQMRGAKQWQIWPRADGAPVELLMRPGDVLVLPQGMLHDVSTPEHPGNSLHLVFAVTDEHLPDRPKPEQASPRAHLPTERTPAVAQKH
ncbi:cupin domain-containing protein [Streptomyces sp. NPDC005423]|uniref:JmjC domain-containing protein n=1 Tax=Streptomyces sp. NPDC005423 TaxID=3155343 RepID=UPI0033ACC006